MNATATDLVHLQWLKDFRIQNFAAANILDVGCGSGHLCQKAMDAGARLAVGVDIVEPRGLRADQQWRFIKADLNAVNWTDVFAGQTFDLIYAFDILEHLDSPFRFLAALRSSTSPGATLVLTTPNVLSWERYLRPNSWSGVRDEQHKTLFTRYSLEFLCRKAGFKPSISKAPVRAFGPMAGMLPQVGGQIICVSHPAS